MGGADIIPGVSGGTMALIVGIYERLISAITDVFTFVLSVFRFDATEIKSRFFAIDWRLLLPLGAGIGSAIFLLAHLINYFLNTYPVECRGLFFGLIAASVAIPLLRIRNLGLRELTLTIVACLLAFSASTLAPHEVVNPSAFQIFGAAAVAICAMILPGVSGAFLLLVLGLYNPTTEAIKSMDIAYIAIFMAGAATGIGLFSRILKWLLDLHHDPTMAALVGLMAGSLRALWPWQDASRALQAPEAGDAIIPVALLAVVGFILITTLVVWEHRRNRVAAQSSFER
jgi:putative membrane protein